MNSEKLNKIYPTYPVWASGKLVLQKGTVKLNLGTQFVSEKNIFSNFNTSFGDLKENCPEPEQSYVKNLALFFKVGSSEQWLQSY